jgi:hypothetical protein
MNVVFERAVLVGELLCAEPDFTNGSQPVALREEATDVLIQAALPDAPALPEEIAHAKGIAAIVRIRIPGPLEITEPTRPGIMTAVGGCLLEMLRGPIGDEESHSARTTVHKGGRDGPPELIQSDHIVNGIMDEYGIEESPQANRPHVALDMFTFGIQCAADCKHPGGKVDQCKAEVLLQV